MLSHRMTIHRNNIYVMLYIDETAYWRSCLCKRIYNVSNEACYVIEVE